ncbi:gamma-glutamylcyclotransferase family protein [Halomonas sp. HP20-15]|uniref:gamma-glutamylcyclotransferase family protein n=1 Tax=Halomonas sp. HP20-15 TaxID=3085901 RepID=UPI002980E9A2|nr:gamma-glutamylcyclotransferase family protein [Halomonas sp. HP20-15]MDW5378175.1 gamma-glutamylcyclotransferase family protein [Halomonas sp. HP20-15]
MAYYFAYGSNMNIARVAARIGETRRVRPGVLEDYALRFDKTSLVPGIAHANVVAEPGARVEGALFELHYPEQIALMDPFEGVPQDYCRHARVVETAEGPVEAWVYIAGVGKTRESLRPAREYLDHLLAGKPFLSESYHARLSEVDAVEGLADTTLTMLGLSRLSPR